MKITLSSILAAAAVAVSVGTGYASMQPEAAHVPVQSLKWFDTGIGPMKAATAYGDMNIGGHGTFLRMPKGFVSPVHQHTNAYRAVVVSGTIVNSEVGQPEIRLDSGSYWHQVGGVDHVTKCVANTGCTVFLFQTEKFDFIPKK